MTRTTHRAIAAAFVVLAATLAACNNDKQPSNTTPSTPVAATSPSAAATSAAPQTREQATQAAIDAYVGMQRAFLKATETADPAHPDLAKYATGEALTRLTGALKNYQSQGLRGRGDVTFHPSIESLAPADAPTKAQVRDCMDTSKTSLYKANGEPYQDEPGGLRLVRADVERVDGVWKVTGFGVHGVGTCSV
ncbi:hypothetical protein [Allorhizocola rhizosphaerae]|uniref:hypothetical protein n=1 Tax=Allorhizocola rhizosphaerae TaxID=1872709 RepID=UPI000E3C8D66|nr:hypothetical protein [Allorhizocola rhizosphaerae]